jgi:BirA family biotin operon repressor/biotin-[acetyl-CoA-carboxylase] ligase
MTEPGLSELQTRLLQRLADGRFYSGTELAQGEGLSRTAVWKHIAALEQQLGLTIHRVAGKGYRLAAPLELLERDSLWDSLAADTRQHLAGLHLHQRIDSTNAYLLRLRKSTPGGHACLAEMQTAGRGRSGRQWVSPFGASLYLSILWQFEGPAVLGGLSLAAGVAVVRALNRLGISGVGLKWPNDLLWQGRKLGGILIEMAGESHGPCSVVLGVGLNGKLPATAGAGIDQAWVDLAEIGGGSSPPRQQLAALLIDALAELLSGYSQQGLAAYLPEWRRLNCILDQPVVLHLADRQEQGIARDVNDDGLLLLELADGSRKAYAAGEVRLRLAGAGVNNENA